MEKEDVSDKQTQRLVEKFFKRGLEMLEERYLLDDEEIQNPIHDEASFESYLGRLDSYKESLRLNLAAGNYGHVEWFVDVYLKEKGIIGVRKDSYSYRRLSREFMKAKLKAVSHEEKYLLEGSPSILDADPNGQSPCDTRQVSRLEQGTLISEAILRYMGENKINWGDKTEREVHASLHLFVEVVGDLPIQGIDRRRVGEFKQVLMKLPPNRKKAPKYRDRSFSQILKMDIEKTIAPKTVGKHLSWVRGLFDYACKNGIYTGLNPATDMQPKKTRRPHERSAPFTDAELEEVLRSEEYVEDKHRHPYQFWTPIIALFNPYLSMQIRALGVFRQIAQFDLSDHFLRKAVIKYILH